MADGPCSCGAWHKANEDFRKHVNDYGLKMPQVTLDFTVGKLYSVPFADGIAHGVLREMVIEQAALKFKLQRPVGDIWVTFDLPKEIRSFSGGSSAAPYSKPG
jgi:hypothetical protein